MFLICLYRKRAAPPGMLPNLRTLADPPIPNHRSESFHLCCFLLFDLLAYLYSSRGERERRPVMAMPTEHVKNDLIVRQCLEIHRGWGLSSTSRTLRDRSTCVNGFWRNAMPGLSSITANNALSI
ncbi:MAG: hypothetical protein EWM72_02922 [Nitrospira sp.]|nr:MAG: hypothetical protein EWM72_02922 [Nitrospira sp.]